MNFDDVVSARRSVRAYSPRRVEEAAIERLLNAAVQAPSAMNTQPWAFAVVQNAARLAHYSDLAKRMLLGTMGQDPKSERYAAMLKRESFNIFYDASTLIVICTREAGIYTDADCWLAAENLMLSACNAGLGSCCIGFAIPVLNTDVIRQELGIPKGGRAVAPVIIGYPSGEPVVVRRAAPDILTWIR